MSYPSHAYFSRLGTGTRKEGNKRGSITANEQLVRSRLYRLRRAPREVHVTHSSQPWYALIKE
eukprot:scaffold49606_cov45-Phaeocystis_antarctica.AAC.2